MALNCFLNSAEPIKIYKVLVGASDTPQKFSKGGINVERGFKKDAFRVFTAILGGFRFLGL